MKLYNEKGYFIPHHVSKESPCWVCKAENDNAHTSYCPNIRYLKELKREVKETMNPKDLIKKMRLEDEVFIFEKGWNSALKSYWQMLECECDINKKEKCYNCKCFEELKKE